MVVGKDKTEDLLNKAREAIPMIRLQFGISLGIRVADYDGIIYKVKFDDNTGNFVFRRIPRKYIEDRDSWKDHADYWTGLFKEVAEELTKRAGRKESSR